MIKTAITRLYRIACLALLLGSLVAAKDLVEAHSVRQTEIRNLQAEIHSWNACQHTVALNIPASTKVTR